MLDLSQFVRAEAVLRSNFMSFMARQRDKISSIRNLNLESATLKPSMAMVMTFKIIARN